MKTKVTWFLVSCLMVLSLVLASCAPAVAPEKVKDVTPGEKAAAKEEVAPGVEMVKDALGRLVEKPRYGGTLTYAATAGPTYLDPALGGIGKAYACEGLTRVDFAKGPSGTGECAYHYNFVFFPPGSQLPLLAESWELSGDENTLTFHLRKGVRFHDKPPVNGRELVAQDVVNAFMRCWQSPLSTAYLTYPWATHMESLTAPDKYTVVFKCKPGYSGSVWEVICWASSTGPIFATDWLDKYGDMNDWRATIGTGPFILTDYVPESCYTLVANRNYWQKHPLFPEDTMPYIDTLKVPIIPDASTRLASLRAGKLDQAFYSGVNAILREDAMSLWKTSPELKWASIPNYSCEQLQFRFDTKPYDDRRVRLALSMAIDRQSIINDLYDGEAVWFRFPVANIPELKDIYIPLEQYPESAREQFVYNPEKAKQYLAEAGYPNGFKAEILCTAAMVDILSVVKEYWSKIGVDLKLDVKESAVYTTMSTKRSFTQGICSSGNVGDCYNPLKLYSMIWTGGAPGRWNYSYVNDPIFNKAYEESFANYWNYEKRVEIMKAIYPHMLDLVTHIQMPGPYMYVFWQPWLKCYSGETYVGYGFGTYGERWGWIDQDLKEKMTGR